MEAKEIEAKAPGGPTAHREARGGIRHAARAEPTRAVTRRAAFAVALAAAALSGGCAKPDFPSGGPIDTVPPRVLLTTPADSTTRVSPQAEIQVLFSESMDRCRRTRPIRHS
ncbi:MAG: hypothetical protein E6K77_09640 [Candidatus Eisenbacteria bacterium]|uniref:SbsA Ig-like domain-containing protein n=1 Tax=Eiseniibacteriota bacterium TaxID=2212470 RepID=A0A538TDJ5_UNCEI|nr:MAG: hypothetical protein E6K77_09640 [Candidatus Eisenbacteria bacterium]